MQRDYDEYRRMQSGSDEARRETGANDVSLEKRVEQKSLRSWAADAEDMMEALSSAPQLIQTVNRVVHVSKEGYICLKRNLSNNLQVVRWTAEAITMRWAEREAKLSALKLKVLLLAEKKSLSAVCRIVRMLRQKRWS